MQLARRLPSNSLSAKRLLRGPSQTQARKCIGSHLLRAQALSSARRGKLSTSGLLLSTSVAFLQRCSLFVVCRLFR